MSDKKVFTMQAEKDLLALFKAACESNDETQSQVVRRFMRQYIERDKQPDLFVKPDKY